MRAALPWNCSVFAVAPTSLVPASRTREVPVLSVMLDVLLLLQPDATGVPDAGGVSGGGGGSGGCAAGDPTLFMMLGMFALMYFVIFGPERKRQKRHQEMLKALKKGDVVRTDGGIRGEILSLTDREAVLLVDVKTKINVLRSRIAGPDAGDESADKAEKPKDEGEKGKDKEG